MYRLPDTATAGQTVVGGGDSVLAVTANHPTLLKREPSATVGIRPAA